MILSSCAVGIIKWNHADKLSLSTLFRINFIAARSWKSFPFPTTSDALFIHRLFSHTKKWMLFLSIEGPKRFDAIFDRNESPQWQFDIPRLTWNTSTMPNGRMAEWPNGRMECALKRSSVLRVSYGISDDRTQWMKGTPHNIRLVPMEVVTAGVSALLLLNGRPRLIARQYSK